MSTETKITTINVENIPCYCSIGIHEEERKMGQRLYFDIQVNINASKIESEDNIGSTISYVDIYKIVQKIGKSKSYQIIEALAESIAEELLKHNFILGVTVTVRKPHIPYPDFQGDVSIIIKRTKN